MEGKTAVAATAWYDRVHCQRRAPVAAVAVPAEPEREADGLVTCGWVSAAVDGRAGQLAVVAQRGIVAVADAVAPAAGRGRVSGPWTIASSLEDLKTVTYDLLTFSVYSTPILFKKQWADCSLCERMIVIVFFFLPLGSW